MMERKIFGEIAANHSEFDLIRCSAAGHEMQIDSAVAALSALGHRLRLRIWRMLAPHGSIGLPAGTISTRLSVPPSSLSFHLQQMTHSRILVQRRSSRQIIYAVNGELINDLTLFLASADVQAGDGAIC